MKRIVFIIVVAFLAFSIAVQAQTSGPQPSPEHKKLEVWAGTWTIQGEGKDSPSGPSYKFDWTMEGRWLPGGFFLEVHGLLKYPDGEDRWLEVVGYDPIKKTYVGYVFNYSGTSFFYTMTLSDRTCFENGTSYSPDGKGTKWRQIWNFAPDLMSVTGKREIEKDGTWWTEFEAKGVRSLAEEIETEMDMPEEAIRAAGDDLASAISRLDAEAVTNLFSKISGTKYITDGKLVPQEGLLETFKELYGSLQEMNFIFEKKEVHVFDRGTAVFTGWVTYTAVSKKGEKIDEKAVYTMVYVSENGKWSIFQAHKSLIK